MMKQAPSPLERAVWVAIAIVGVAVLAAGQYELGRLLVVAVSAAAILRFGAANAMGRGAGDHKRAAALGRAGGRLVLVTTGWPFWVGIGFMAAGGFFVIAGVWSWASGGWAAAALGLLLVMAGLLAMVRIQ
jgi:hypothetical protein